MILVANRISVAKGFEKAFEERFMNRARKVDRMPGFIRNEVLRPLDSEFYVILTYWKDKKAFTSWTESKEFREAHKNKPHNDMFSGPNVFEMHEVIECSEKKEIKKDNFN
tara:strand:- start:85 stop:414 length:330 start_codon:yes stop_codon:yes gene_type:complete